jgi:glycosyltransferase involved in cell wall biosynthesis
LRVLVLHNRYQQDGGEDRVASAEAGLLERAGHIVHQVVVSNEDIASFADKVRTFVRVPHDPDRLGWMNRLVDEYQPEVVHIHNFFPLLTPAIHEAAAARGVAVVQSLHNFRLTCAAATLTRNEVTCEKCVGGAYAWAVWHRCYRNSLAGSLAVARMQFRARHTQVWNTCVHRFITFSEHGRALFIRAGLPESRISVKPHFVADEPVSRAPRTGRILFVGRASADKGLGVLLQACLSIKDVQLRVIGVSADGRPAQRNVSYLGWLDRIDVRREMGEAALLIVPSLAAETFGLVALEAFSVGLPVIASRRGALEELVAENVNGRLVTPGDADELGAVIRELLTDTEQIERLSMGARATYCEKYTEAKNVQLIEQIYRDAIAEAHQTRKEQ